MKVNDIDMDAVILGNGEYPTHSMPETMLIMAPYVVCCDGSADEHIRRGFTPDAIIGDGDSLSPENKERFRPKRYTSCSTKAKKQSSSWVQPVNGKTIPWETSVC